MEDDLVLVDMSIDPSLKQGEEEKPLNMEVDKMQVSTSLSSAQTDKTSCRVFSCRDSVCRVIWSLGPKSRLQLWSTCPTLQQSRHSSTAANKCSSMSCVGSTTQAATLSTGFSLQPLMRLPHRAPPEQANSSLREI